MAPDSDLFQDFELEPEEKNCQTGGRDRQTGQSVGQVMGQWPCRNPLFLASA